MSVCGICRVEKVEFDAVGKVQKTNKVLAPAFPSVCLELSIVVS